MVEVIYVRARLIPVPHTGGVHINAPMDERKRSSDKSVDNQQRNEDTADRGRLVRTTPISAACAAGAGGEARTVQGTCFMDTIKAAGTDALRRP